MIRTVNLKKELIKIMLNHHRRECSYPGNLTLFQIDIQERLNELQCIENGTINLEKFNESIVSGIMETEKRY